MSEKIYASKLLRDLYKHEDLLAAIIIGKPGYCDQTFFCTRINIEELDELDLDSINDVIKCLNSMKETLLRRKIKLEDIKYGEDVNFMKEAQKVAKQLGVDNERI